MTTTVARILAACEAPRTVPLTTSQGEAAKALRSRYSGHSSEPERRSTWRPVAPPRPLPTRAEREADATRRARYLDATRRAA